MYTTEQFEETRRWLAQRLPDGWSPRLAVVCGSGLGGLATTMSAGPGGLTAPIELPYTDIPHFCHSTVHGHAGKLVFGMLGEAPTVCMVGRFHFYEGHALDATTFPVRIFALLGVETLLLTNAAGSLNHAGMRVGHVMVVADHLNFPGMAGHNPLMGRNLDSFGPRFPATSDAYDRQLRRLALQAGKDLGLDAGVMSEGVYAFVAGPSYETKAEARFLRMAGADVVGMSTVPEVIVARHCGLRVLVLSLVTNLVVMTDDRGTAETVDPVKATHEEVLQASAERAVEMQALVQLIAARLVDTSGAKVVLS